MKRIKKFIGFLSPWIHDLIPHLSLVLCLMHITFLVVDLFNRAMAFVNNDITKWLLLITAVLMLLLCNNLRKSDLYKQKRVIRVTLRICVVTACFVLFIFFMDREAKVINTSTVKYTLYVFALASSVISVVDIIYRRSLNHV